MPGNAGGAKGPDFRCASEDGEVEVIGDKPGNTVEDRNRSRLLNGRRVGIRIITFEACSGFTRVTARRIAQPPNATFVTRLQLYRLPGRAARQLPDQSTTLWVDSSSTDDRAFGAHCHYQTLSRFHNGPC